MVGCTWSISEVWVSGDGYRFGISNILFRPVSVNLVLIDGHSGADEKEVAKFG